MFRLTFRIRFWGIRNIVWFLWPSDVPNYEDLTKEVLRQEREREIYETYCISRTVEPSQWVLVRFATKKRIVQFVGQVTKKISDAVYEIMFLRKHSLNSKETTFNWPDNQDIHFVDAQDIKTILPKPNLGRRGELYFEVTFSSYNLQ